jgi:hypothetical protein
VKPAWFFLFLLNASENVGIFCFSYIPRLLYDIVRRQVPTSSRLEVKMSSETGRGFRQSKRGDEVSVPEEVVRNVRFDSALYRRAAR